MTRKIPGKRDTNLIFISSVILFSIIFTILLNYNGFSKNMAFLSTVLLQAVTPFFIIRLLRCISDLQYMWKEFPTTPAVMPVIYRSIKMSGEIQFYFVFTLLLNILYWNYKETETEDMFKSIASFLLLPTVTAIFILRQMDEYPLKKAIDIEQSYSTMANGFYYGYLKIICPTLQEKIEGFMNTEKIGIKVKKLLILIPSSAVLFDEVKTLETANFEESKNLAEHNITRAFVVNRSYKNSVYIITDHETEERYYTVCEGATPIKTFYERCREDPSSKQYIRETVYSFYRTLKELVDEDHFIKNFVELLYYEDDERPGHGTKTTKLNNIILNRLKEISRQEEQCQKRG